MKNSLAIQRKLNAARDLPIVVRRYDPNDGGPILWRWHGWTPEGRRIEGDYATATRAEAVCNAFDAITNTNTD